MYCTLSQIENHDDSEDKYFVVILFFFFFFFFFAAIVTAPSDAVTVPGGIVTFNCLVNGQGYWTVNRVDPSSIPGFTFTIVEEQTDTDSESVMTIMNLTAVGLRANNASRVQCHGIDDFGTATERSAVLIIAGNAAMVWWFTDAHCCQEKSISVLSTWSCVIKNKMINLVSLLYTHQYKFGFIYNFMRDTLHTCIYSDIGNA